MSSSPFVAFIVAVHPTIKSFARLPIENFGEFIERCIGITIRPLWRFMPSSAARMFYDFGQPLFTSESNEIDISARAKANARERRR